MKRLLVLLLLACDPPPVTPTTPVASSQASAQAQTPTENIDVRVEFERTSDTYASYISAFLVIPAMAVHVQLFTVPFPYRCMRGESDEAHRKKSARHQLIRQLA